MLNVCNAKELLGLILRRGEARAFHLFVYSDFLTDFYLII